MESYPTDSWCLVYKVTALKLSVTILQENSLTPFLVCVSLTEKTKVLLFCFPPCVLLPPTFFMSSNRLIDYLDNPEIVPLWQFNLLEINPRGSFVQTSFPRHSASDIPAIYQVINAGLVLVFSCYHFGAAFTWARAAQQLSVLSELQYMLVVWSDPHFQVLKSPLCWNALWWNKHKESEFYPTTSPNTVP